MLIKRNRYCLNISLLLLLLVCVLFSWIKFFSYFALAIFVIQWIGLWYYDKTFFLKYMVAAFTLIGDAIGIAVIEIFPSIYLGELRCQSYFTGALPLFIFCSWISLFVLEIMDYRYRQSLENISIEKIKDKSFKKRINLFACFSCVILIIQLLYAISYFPPSFSLGVDRFVYDSNYSFPWILNKVKNLAPVLVCLSILALLYANKAIGLVGVAAYFIYFLWIGEKFGSFFTLLSILMICYYNKFVNIKKGKRRKITVIAIIILIVLVLVAVFIASNIIGISPYEYFVHRTAQQGQLWWKTYDITKGKVHPLEFKNEIYAFIEGNKPIQECVGANNGIYKIMYLCAPEAVVTNKLASGSRYSEAGYALMYYYFGVPGLIIYSILFGIIISGVIRMFINALQTEDYIKAMIYVRFFMLTRTAFSMFTFGDFLDIISILSYAYLIFAHVRSSRIKYHVKINMREDRGGNSK